MKLSRLTIDQYGPLTDVDLRFNPTFQVVAGPNESGKTLLVEALLRLLFDDGDHGFDRLDRVNQPPAGFVSIDTTNGAVMLPEAGFGSVFPSLSPRDVRNAFVIRDFDLRIPRSVDYGHADYFRTVTDRLTGAQTDQIRAVRDELQSLGYLTNNSSSSRLVDQKPHYLKTNRDCARVLKEDLESYLTDTESGDVLGLVGRKRRLEREHDEVSERLNQLAQAREYERYSRGNRFVSELGSVREELESIELSVGSDRDQLEALRDRGRSLREQHDAMTMPPSVIRLGLGLTSVLAALSLVALIVTETPGINVITGVLLLILGWFGRNYWLMKRHATQRAAFIADANRTGVPNDTVSDVLGGIEEKRSVAESERDELHQRETRISTRLEEMFGTACDTIEEWRGVLREVEATVSDSEIEFDEAKYESLQDRVVELEAHLDDVETELGVHADQLSKFDSVLRDIPVSAILDTDRVRIQSVADIPEAIDQLDEFVATLDQKVRTAQQAIAILESLEAEEVHAINYLFSTDSTAVEFLRTVTNGNYTDIHYDETDYVITVTRADGRELPVDQVSQGTYDLIYLAIRIALATELLNDTPGFLVLDDPFIHSDADRLIRELELLSELTESGWQVVYFSARPDVREFIRTREGGSLIDLPAIEFST